jgi:uncharacterized protein YcbK (DUF882 family)
LTQKTAAASEKTDPTLGRRGFLKVTVLSALAAVFPTARPLASPAKPALPGKTLSFFNTHTGETIRTDYWENGRYAPDALAGIDRILRDHRSGETHAIDPNLLDVLHALSRKLETHSPFHVISGYRSPTTNAALREQSHGVAAGSLHMVGQAIDIRLPGVALADLRRSVLALCAGGVGYYPRPDFIHVDIGRVRSW